MAADCAETAVRAGASQVELLALEKLSEMPLTRAERDCPAPRQRRGLRAHPGDRDRRARREDRRRPHPQGHAAAGRHVPPARVVDLSGTEQERPDIDLVVVAIGARGGVPAEVPPGVFFAGDVEHGPTTVVEAVAAGKNAALAVLRHLVGAGGRTPDPGPRTPSQPSACPPRQERRRPPRLPSLPRPPRHGLLRPQILSPFLLSAAPPTDGYEQMKKAYEAGWAGGVMKTAFDDVPIHIPGEYMFAVQPTHLRQLRQRLRATRWTASAARSSGCVKEYPDRLTMASTGGPVTGNDERDRRGWQSNTAKLERAGAMGIEYSLSCPQGGDGTKGDIVSQDAELTAKIIDWVLEVGDPDVPKLFKLTAAVTSIYPIIAAIQEVFARYPTSKAGVTLANTFPTLAFRPGGKAAWDEGVVVGMTRRGRDPDLAT